MRMLRPPAVTGSYLPRCERPLGASRLDFTIRLTVESEDSVLARALRPDR